MHTTVTPEQALMLRLAGTSARRAGAQRVIRALAARADCTRSGSPRRCCATTLNCAAAANTNAPFEVRFTGQIFRLTSTGSVSCTDDPAVTTPAAGFDTMAGSGTGSLTRDEVVRQAGARRKERTGERTPSAALEASDEGVTRTSEIRGTEVTVDGDTAEASVVLRGVRSRLGLARRDGEWKVDRLPAGRADEQRSPPACDATRPDRHRSSAEQ